MNFIKKLFNRSSTQKLITNESFSKAHNEVTEAYREVRNTNEKILACKLKAAPLWIENARKLTEDIKDFVTNISVYQSPKNDLESTIVHPKVFLKIELVNMYGKFSEIQVEVFQHEHDNSKQSILELVHAIRTFKQVGNTERPTE